jgi:hypothetical protein
LGKSHFQLYLSGKDFAGESLYPAWAIRAVASVYVLLHLLVATIEGVPNVLDFRLRVSIGLTVAALWMVPLLVAGKSPLLILASGFVFAFWFAWAMRTDEGRRRWQAMMRLYVRLGPTALVILLLWHSNFGDRIIYMIGKILVLGLAFFFTMAFTNMAIKAIKNAMERTTVLGRDGLVKEIHAILTEGDISSPIWATTAAFVELYDPDRASTFTDGRSGTIEAFHTLRGTWIPHYWELSKLPKLQVIELCLASAALPFGIVSPVVVGDVKHVDGGVVDNCPIFPFMDKHEVDEVFIVSLTPREKANGELEKNACIKRWKEIRRTIDVFNYDGPRPISSGGNVPPAVIPYREPEFVPQFIPFSPDKNLGRLFTGTLNFTPGYARRLIKQGCLETRSRLKQLGLRPVAAIHEVQYP